MTRLLRCSAALVALVLLLPTTAVATDGWPSADRVYLLGSNDEFLYWSVDPGDPELGAGRVERQCSTAVPNGVPGSNRCDFLFFPATLIRGPLAWGGAKKLRFHLDLQVETPGTPQVTVSAYSQNVINQTPATETAPGVWEAAVAAGGIDPSSWSMLAVRVTADVPHLTATLNLGGKSYVDLPTPIVGAGVPQLRAEAPVPVLPQTIDVGLRSFTFNDDQWSLSSFTGDLSEAKDFEVLLAKDASSVVAWIEIFESPFVYDVVRGGSPDAGRLIEGSEVELRRQEATIAYGGNSGEIGVGTNAAAAVDVPAGPLTLHVDAPQFRGEGLTLGSGYTAHVLTVFGDRTLARMRWPAMFGGYPGITATNAPLIGVCPGDPQQQIPVSTKVTSLAVDMRVDTVGGPTSQWALAYLLRPNSWLLCDEASGGQSMRFTYPNHGVQLVGPTVKRDTTWAEWRDTLFEFDARFTYSAPAA